MQAEKGRSNKWLAQQIGKVPATVSKWCINATQPGLEHYCKSLKYYKLMLKNY